MQKSILMIQFRTGASEKHEQACVPDKVVHKREDNIRFHFMNAFDIHCGWSDDIRKLLFGFDGVILGGSSDFYFGGNVSQEKETVHWEMVDRVRPLVRYALEHDFPTLGICFGHQMLGYFLHANVVDDPNRAESGSFPVFLTAEGVSDPLFRGIPQHFLSFFVHRDSIEHVPDESVLLASGPKCHVGAFRFKQHVYGVQFHPELSREDVRIRAGMNTKYLEEHYLKTSFENFFRTLEDTAHASKIIDNFIELCR
jgi:GMP synthase (glutamine-hydrolysing)